ncbi:coiled-coil domain-containing protein 50 isoform X2 [Amia ocellicauda]|uniref:coiled-coil domain-containing protein 50 isoform X2 n=1 Tax=Amia ocellicauda TaxID=2972642 RepID=UPI003463EC13
MTELEIDQSHLPRVQEVCQCFAVLEDGALAHNLQEQEIEQYYSSNVQKSQLVQRDTRIARRLQDEEEERSRRQQDTRHIEEQDSEYARAIQEELQRRAEEALRREEEDEEIAKRLQQEEELEIRTQRLDSICQRDEDGFPSNEGAGPCRAGASLELGALEQVLLDEELARRLQEEEELLLRKSPQSTPTPQNPDPEGDFIAAQVAQDEEIARFMQRQEMKTQRRSRDLEGQESQHEYRDPGDPSERRSVQERKTEAPPAQRERLDSEGLPSPGEDGSPERHTSPAPPLTPPGTALQQPPIRNIAEELDPTFKGKRQESSASGHTLSASAHYQPSPAPRFFDYLEDRSEPTFIPPTKRQSDKAGRPKTKDKKESCKQQ